MVCNFEIVALTLIGHSCTASLNMVCLWPGSLALRALFSPATGVAQARAEASKRGPEEGNVP